MEVVEEASEGFNKEGICEVNETIEVGQTIKKKIVLRAKGSQTGTKENVAEVEAKENVGENRSNVVTTIIAVKTGIEPIYVVLTMGVLVMLEAGVYLIKTKAL